MIDIEALLKVVDVDASARGEYITDTGHTCFLGGLLLASGEFTPETLREYMSKRPDKGRRRRNTRSIKDSGMEYAQSVLFDHFGLDSDSAAALQWINDLWRIRSTRQAMLRRSIERLKYT